MSCPGTYPTVLNGQVYYNDSSTVEFECLSGFYMTGNKRITCSAGVWETAPTCSVIRQYDEVTVFPDWWLIVAAIVGGLLVLACLLCVICYFCCGRADNSVYPYSRYNNGCCGDGGCCGGCCIMCGSGSCCRCCRSSGQSKGDYSSDGEDGHHKTTGTAASANGVYFVPVTSSPPQTHSCNGDRPIKPHKRAKEVKAWLPHANPVRAINTSTK